MKTITDFNLEIMKTRKLETVLLFVLSMLGGIIFALSFAWLMS